MALLLTFGPPRFSSRCSLASGRRCNIPTLNLPHPHHPSARASHFIIGSREKNEKINIRHAGARLHSSTAPRPSSVRLPVHPSRHRHSTLVLSTWWQSAPPVNVSLLGNRCIGRPLRIRRPSVRPFLFLYVGVRSTDLTSFTRACFLSNGTNLYQPIASIRIGECWDWILIDFRCR